MYLCNYGIFKYRGIEKMIILANRTKLKGMNIEV